MDRTLGFEPRDGGSIPSEGTTSPRLRGASKTFIYASKGTALEKISWASLAQLVEQLPLKEMVGGSNPSRGKYEVFD